MASSGFEVLQLYRQLLKEAKKFPSYMYRMYAVRRIKDAFREHKHDTDAEKIRDLLTYGKENLEIIKRQVIIGKLYRSPENVIEQEVKPKEETLQGG